MKKLNLIKTLSACLIVILCLYLYASREFQTRLKYCLNFEFRKLLAHYDGPSDSLKLKAAFFLLENMHEHGGVDGEEVRKASVVFSEIDTAAHYVDGLTKEEKTDIADSLIRLSGYPVEIKAKQSLDEKTITASFLINNIDYAFKAWRNAPWARKITFNDFCEYILPYRIRDERLQLYRPTFYADYTKMGLRTWHVDSLQSVFRDMAWNMNLETNFDVSFFSYFPFTQGVGDILKGRIGGCETTSLLAVAAMRSAALPVALDFIPHWGNCANQHFMVGLVDRNSKRKLISNKNAPVNTWALVDFSSDFEESRHLFDAHELPPKLYIQYVKTIPKVFRYSYSHNKILKEIHDRFPEHQIAPEFRTTTIKDVSDEYIESVDIDLNIPSGYNDRPLHICVFDIDRWHPIDIAVPAKGKVKFKKIGKNIIYLPAIYEGGEYKGIDKPFLVDSSGGRHALYCPKNKPIQMTLRRKTALYGYTAYHTEVLKGGRFEGANNPDFKNATVLYRIKHYPFYMNEVKVNSNRAFRYLRYVAPTDAQHEADNIAEVSFYGNVTGTPLNGNVIGTPGSEGHGIEKAFDGDILSYYENRESRNGWLGIDLGEHKQSIIKKISFCPRNDANCIIPGNSYELFYWDNEWISLGVKKAEGFSIVYNNAPAGALFWLRCLTEGREERIFIYKDGMQLWY